MRLTVLATVLAVAFALALAAAMGLAAGDPGAVGLAGGAFLGGAVGLAVAAWQRSLLERRPEWAVQSVAISMLVKLVVLGVSGIALGRVAALGDRAEPAHFLITFVVVTLAVAFFGTQDAVKVLRGGGRASALATAPISNGIHAAPTGRQESR